MNDTARTETPSRYGPRAWLVVAGLSMLPYLLTAWFPFAYDDYGQILENPFLRNYNRVTDLVTLDTLNNPHVVNGRRPVAVFTHLVDFQIWNLSPVGYHVTSALLHALAVLAFGLFIRTLANRSGNSKWELSGLGASLLFGLHPLATEAAHVPSFRPDILFTLFTFLALRQGITLRDTYSGKWLGGIAAFSLFTFLALLSKETAVILPALLSMIWWLYPTTRPRRATAFLLLGISFSAIVLFALLCLGGAPLQAAGGSWNGISLKFPENLLTTPALFTKGLRLLFFPLGLSLDHAIPPGLPGFQALAGVTAMAFMAVAVVVFRRRNPWLALSLSGIMLAFLPVSNLVPLINPFAERYLYLSCAFTAMLVTNLVMQLRGPVGTFEKSMAGLAVILALLTGLRMFDWRSEENIWTKTLHQNPGSVKALTWLGILHKAGDPLKAHEYFVRACELNPQAANDAMVNLAILYGQQGEIQRAETLLREAIRLRPEKAAGYYNLAFDLSLQERIPEAIAVLREGIKVDEMYLPTRLMLAGLLCDSGNLEAALDITRGTLRLDPANEVALELNGYLQWQINNPDADPFEEPAPALQ